MSGEHQKENIGQNKKRNEKEKLNKKNRYSKYIST